LDNYVWKQPSILHFYAPFSGFSFSMSTSTWTCFHIPVLGQAPDQCSTPLNGASTVCNIIPIWANAEIVQNIGVKYHMWIVELWWNYWTYRKRCIFYFVPVFHMHSTRQSLSNANLKDYCLVSCHRLLCRWANPRNSISFVRNI